jgi:hypothetical protein
MDILKSTSLAEIAQARAITGRHQEPNPITELGERLFALRRAITEGDPPPELLLRLGHILNLAPALTRVFEPVTAAITKTPQTESDQCTSTIDNAPTG